MSRWGVLFCFIQVICCQQVRSGQAGFSLSDRQREPQRYFQVKNLIKKYPQERLEKHLRGLVQCCRPSRYFGSSGHSQARAHIVKLIKEIDPQSSGLLAVEEFEPRWDRAIKMYQDDFKQKIQPHYKPHQAEYKKWDQFTKNMISELNKLKGKKGHNIIWEKKGGEQVDEVLLVGAHYDTIVLDKKSWQLRPDSSMPGADDNASGVAIALSMIDFLSELKLKKTVQVVFFDLHEFGFLGSRAFLERHAGELQQRKFIGFINLLMLGHDSKRNDKTKRTKNFRIYLSKEGHKSYDSSFMLAQRVRKWAHKYSSSFQWEQVPNGFGQGDNTIFWDQGLPAIVASQNWENDFNAMRNHTPNDFVETLNLRSYDLAFRTLLSSVLAHSLSL